MFRTAALAGMAAFLSQAAFAQVTVFENVRIFDGTSDQLSQPMHVLVRDNIIQQIGADPIPSDRSGTTTLIDGGGRTLMPGLIDAHTHLVMGSIPQGAVLSRDQNYVMLRAGAAAEDYLMRGFTTARDAGGPTFGLKEAIMTIGAGGWAFAGATVSVNRSGSGRPSA